MFEEVCALLAEQLPVKAGDITRDSRIKEDLGADSLDVLQLLMTLEEEKGIVIPDEVLPTMKTVGDFVDFMEKQA